MIQSNKALYQEINSIIEILNSSGNKEYAQKLSNALSISTVPSEVLGESRLVLKELSETALPIKLNISTKLEEALKYLNRIL